MEPVWNLWCRQNITLPGTAPGTVKPAANRYNDSVIPPPMTDNLFVLLHLLEAGINAETRMLRDIRAVSARLITAVTNIWSTPTLCMGQWNG
jgi:hypothetical protein